MAGQNPIFNAATVQGEAHVGTAVVHCEHLSGVKEQGDGVSTRVDDATSALFELIQGSDIYEPIYRSRHGALHLIRRGSICRWL